MATPESLAETVRTAITSGSASASTVTTLHTLLRSVPRPGSQLETARTAGLGVTNTAKPVRPAARTKISKRDQDQTFNIHEDSSRTLAPKARYALATDIVNICLKVLSDASTAALSSQRRDSGISRANGTATPRRHSRTPSLSQRALQLRSGNTTPVRQAPVKQSVLSRTASQGSVGSSSPSTAHLTAVAECARLGFSLLGTADVKKMGVRALPKLQLESGMISLVGMLVILRLDTMAVKELRGIKRRLESVLTFPERNPSAGPRIVEKETLASLLHLDVDFNAHPEAIPVAITYQLHVLRIIILSHKPATIDEALQYLTLDACGSPANLIMLSANSAASEAKATRQLEALAQSLLQLCPSVSRSADEAAQDSSRSPSPMAAFQLQTLALQIRQEAWKISKRSADLLKEVAEPFSKCMSTLVRRFPSDKHASTLYHACMAAHSTLGLSANKVHCPGKTTISRTFALLADAAALPDQAYAWAETAIEDCRDLERSHARSVTAMAFKLSLFLGAPRPAYDIDCVISDINHIANSLRCRPPGSKSDYEQLIAELSRLAGATMDLIERVNIQESWKELLRSAAAFASVCASMLPENNLPSALAIVNTALLHSHTSEELLSWVSKDTARLFKHAGAFRTVVESASTMPMARAWRSSSVTLGLSRVLRGLVIKALRSESGKHAAMLFDDDCLEPSESGALLEWQLTCALEMAHKQNYQKAMQVIVPHMLNKLLAYYPATLHPIRRSRVAAVAMRVREQFPELLPPHLLQPFLATSTIDVHALGKDVGLQAYASDINASIGISLAMRSSPVAFSEITSNLQVWQNLIEASNQSGTLANVVDNSLVLLSQLTSIEEYAGVMGLNQERLCVARMLLRASELCNVRPRDRCNYSLRIVSSLLSLGQAENAGVLLQKSKQLIEEDEYSGIAILEYYLAEAEHHLALDRVKECQAMLLKAQEVRTNLEPQKVKSHQSKLYKQLHGSAWLLQSRCFLASGLPHDSLRAARRSARVLNSIWSGIERTVGQVPDIDASEMQSASEESSIDNLSKKVSKLNLQPKSRDSKTSAKSEVKGAAFWSAARLLCRALMHLCDVYVHHGVFLEANHSSEQAMRIAESIQSQVLLSRVRSHRCNLLSAAGRVEEAELCLAQDESDASTVPSLATVERLRAKYALSLKTGEFEGALEYIKDAVVAIHSLQCDEQTTEKQNKVTVEDTASATLVKRKASPKTTSRSTTSRLPPKARPVPKTTSRAVASSKTGKAAAQLARSQGPQIDRKSTCYMLEKLEAQLVVQGAIIMIKLGHDEDEITARLDDAITKLPVSFARYQLEHDSAMRKVAIALGSDFAYNVLPESTLSLPAVQATEPEAEGLSSNAVKPTTKGKRHTKGSKRTISSVESLGSLLLAAQQCLILDSSVTRLLTTFETHRQYSMLSNSAMLLSATTPGNEVSRLNAVQEALAVDYPRIHAAKCQLGITELENENFQAADLLAWPSSKPCKPEMEIMVDQFQTQYVDILPFPWTAVSIGLNQDCDELYITRYRREQSPFVLRLPFSRQKSEDVDHVFDFHMGRDELKEIIELSNYSCHNPIDAGVKGAKNNWWSEREALDLRLHELLQNIENIWLGGFRGALSQHTKKTDQLGRFRKEFEMVLDRHLPSRQATKRGSTRLSLDDHVLELFIGLGSDQDGEIDLDEPLSDLLYFVVDVLQFSGERNAYDEVDFDSMTIAVLDALRSYHDNVDVEDQDDAHLILVLDRRLQAFPWESLPCLKNASVSRVDSMLCLRDRIVEMRKWYGDESERLTVTQKSGSYILNPSADLKNTETSLAPELSELALAEDAKWTAIVRRGPTEEEFSNALNTSSMLLYFGHGAGSQYIRPRAIRRLTKCSEVVWLMGCSSGATTEHDELEPHAVPLAYLAAGQQSQSLPEADVRGPSKCMSVLATLWDVTDKDIDRFSLAVGEEWGLWGAPQESTKAPAKTPRKREAVAAAPLTPQRGAKTPKTPKAKKTPAPARTPARSRSRGRDAGKKQSLVQAVAKSRDACYLRYLNGAAPVVYGVPVYLGK